MASITYTDEFAGTLTASPAELLSARLDRLPMTRTLWIMAALVSLGGFFDAMALELAATLAPGLFHDRILTATTVGFFGNTGLASFIAALFAGMFVGTRLFSKIADLFGRRTIFAFALLWYGVGTVMMAFQYTAGGLTSGVSSARLVSASNWSPSTHIFPRLFQKPRVARRSAC